MRHQPIIGFDRKIELDWLDAAAGRVAAGDGDAEVRAFLWRLLDGEVRGESSHSARGKTVTVLSHVWSRVPEAALPLREGALELLTRVEPRERLALHWTMALATYPFFVHVADVTGRLLTLYGECTLSQLTRRAIERWGDRSTVRRAVQRVVRSMVAWGALREGEERGFFVPGEARLPVTDAVGELLLEAVLLSSESELAAAGQLLRHPALFPFEIAITTGALRRAERFEVYREGLDLDMVGLAAAS